MTWAYEMLVDRTDQSVDSDHWPKFDLLELSYQPVYLSDSTVKLGALGAAKRTTDAWGHC